MTLQAGHAASPRSSRGGRFARAGLLALGAACCAPDAVAAPMPAEVAEGIARIGPVINLGDTAALYAAAHAAQAPWLKPKSPTGTSNAALAAAAACTASSACSASGTSSPSTEGRRS